MTRSSNIPRACVCAAALALAVMLAMPPAAPADPTPVHLILQNGDGSSASYPLSEIQRLSFSGTDLVVVPRSGEPALFPFNALRSLQTDAALVAVDPGLTNVPVEPVQLLQNRPNPASGGTRIGFELPRRGRVSVELYEVSGRRIRTLADQEFASGRYEIDWNGTDARGRRVSAGVYFYRLKGVGADLSRRMVVLP